MELPNKEVKQSFIGKCSKCNIEGEVRYVKQYKGFDNFSQEIELIGPFDKYCAYMIKFNDPPFFETQPKSFMETIYRYLVRKEIPFGEKKQKIVKNEILSNLRSIGPLIIIYPILALLLVVVILPLIILVIPFYLIAVPIMVLQISLLSIIGIKRLAMMFSKHPGKTKMEHFEKFWEGNVVRQDISIHHFSRLVLNYSIIIPIIILLYSIEGSFSKLFIGEIYQLYSLLIPFNSSEFYDVFGLRIYHFVVFIICFTVMVQIYSMRAFMPWDRLTPMPDDIYEIARNRKTNNKARITNNLSEGNIHSRNPFSFLTKRILSRTTDGMFICQICKSDVFEYEIKVFCDNCSRYFHENHLKTYIAGLKLENLAPVCPVCYYDAYEVFTELNLKSETISKNNTA